MSMILSIFLWLLLGFISAYYARERGRDPIAWFVIGILLGLIGIIILFLLPSLSEPKKENSGSVEEGFRAVIPSEAGELSQSTQEWFYVDKEGKAQGPFAQTTMKEFFSEGKIDVSTFVWHEGMENWKRINDLPDLSFIVFLKS